MSARESKHMPTRDGTATRRRWGFRLGAVLLVPFLLTSAEMVLRLADWPPPILPTVPESWGDAVQVVTPTNRQVPLETYTDSNGVLRARTTEAMRRAGLMHDVDYPVEREEGTFRVFCLGGSATLGVPVEREPARTFPGRLETLLHEAGLEAEVFNLGGASFGSDEVVKILNTVITHDPSAVVVYSGNNEFFNYALQIFKLNRNQAARIREAPPLHLLRLLSQYRTAPRIDPDGPQPADIAARQRELVMAVVQNDLREHGDAALPKPSAGLGFERRDTPYQVVMSRYARNLEALVERVAQSNSPPSVYLVKLPANLLEPPWHSWVPRTLSHWEEQRLEKDLSSARDSAGDLERTDALLDQVLEQVPFHAEAHYLRGMAALNHGDTAKALLHLEDALQLDMVPGRPLAAQNAAMDELGRLPGVHVVDPTASIIAVSLARGEKPLFHDSCHLTAAGYDRVARSIAKTLLENEVRHPVEED